MFEKRAVEAWTLKDEVKGEGFRKNTNVSNLKKVKTIDLEEKVNATIVERKINIFFFQNRQINFGSNFVDSLLYNHFIFGQTIDVLLMKL